MSTVEAIDLNEKVNDPDTSRKLGRLVDQAGELSSLLEWLGSAQVNFNQLVATATDAADETCQSAVSKGIDLEARIRQVMELFEKATRPETLAVLGSLVDRLPQIEKLTRLLDDLPGLVAILADVFDEFSRDAAEQGLDLERCATNGIRSLLWLGQQVNKEELERIGLLLKSDMLAPESIEVVANAASSLVYSQSEACETGRRKNQRVGLFGLLAAIRNENIQRAIGFAISFGKCFGANLKNKAGDS